MSETVTKQPVSSVGEKTRVIRQKSSRGRSLLVNVVIPLLMLGGAASVVVALGTVEPEKKPDPDTSMIGRLRSLPPVRIERLQSLESTGQQLRLKVDGTVVPYREARVAAEVAGRVIFKADECEAGTYVKAGQLLMKIDPTDHDLELQRLTRLREQEYEALQENDQEMANANRLIGVAKQDVNLQQNEVNRLKSMPKGFASVAEIDQANRALLGSRQQLVNAENQLDLLRKRHKRLEASERLAETQVNAAKVNLERCEIRAPIDGVIVNEDAELNTFVRRGDMLVTIDDTSKVDVLTNLRMDQLYWVLDQNSNSGNDQFDPSVRGYNLPETPAIIEYELAGREGVVYRWRGRLLSYNGIGLDQVTRTVPVRVVVDDPTEYIDEQGNTTERTRATALVRGMFVSVNLLIEPKSRLVVVPALALQPGNRVLQFIPDQSVLKPTAGAVAAQSTSAGSASGESTAVDAAVVKPAQQRANTGSSFEPDMWIPGRVVVKQNINPIDSLMLKTVGLESQPSLSTFGPEGRRTVWVCEVGDDSLSSDSLVVVSPLGSAEEEEEVSVRAQRIEDDDQTAVTSPSTNNVVTHKQTSEAAR